MGQNKLILGSSFLLSLLFTVSQIEAAPCPQYPMPFTSYSDPVVFECAYYLQKYPDLAQSFAGNCESARRHWVNTGIGEGRSGSSRLHPVEYLAEWPDVSAALGNTNYRGAVAHYLTYGRCEGRRGHRARGPTFSNDSRLVMKVPFGAYAYQFFANKIDKGPSPYAATFDAEVWNRPYRTNGDSLAVRYGSAFDFGTHNFQKDLLISRSNDGQSLFMNDGSSNPQLLMKKDGTGLGIYWLTVARGSTGLWNHFVHFALMDPANLGSMLQSPIFYYTGPYTNPYWGSFQHVTPNSTAWGAMVNQPLKYAYPISQVGGGLVQNEFGTTDWNQTTGLIGTMTTGGDGQQYFYYTDYVRGRSVLYRRTVMDSMVEMSRPQLLGDFGDIGHAPYMLVNYHRDLKEYVVLYYCATDYYDICLRRFKDSELSQPADQGPAISGVRFGADAPRFGLGLKNDPLIPHTRVKGVGCAPGDPKVRVNYDVTNFAVGQFGIRRDLHGRHFSDGDGQVILYFQVGAPSVPCLADPIWGNTYGKRIFITMDPF